MDTAERRKARGAFFTPPDLTNFVVGWAVRGAEDRVLEPSCGEAAFLVPAGLRLRDLGAAPVRRGQLHGIEIHSESARNAARALADHGLPANVKTSDFFGFPGDGAFDAVVGNPPYVRYQNFSGDARLKAQAAALKQGVRVPGLASSWAAFTVHAAAFLRPGGRLGLVLPAELLSVNYAAPIRRFLLRRFRSVRLVLFEARVFPGVHEEVVLLLAEGEGPTDRCELFQVTNAEELSDLETRLGAGRGDDVTWTPFTGDSDAKWTEALVPGGLPDLYRELLARPEFGTLGDWGDVYLGTVTGNNHYFTLTAGDAEKWSIPDEDLVAISPPGSRHLRGLAFSSKDLREMTARGARGLLFFPDLNEPSAPSRRYIEHGESEGVQHAYKCRVRAPWWRVPTVRVPDLFFTYMNHDVPRLVANDARVLHLNSVHGLALKKGIQGLGRDLLSMAALNSATLLGAELLGRSYGGGILKLEPKEALRLPAPAPRWLKAVGSELRAIRPKVAAALVSGRIDDAVREVDRALLLRSLRFPSTRTDDLRRARRALFERRLARSRKRP
ncbi:MAG: N-6 DNA methylase [Myxococcales bacterium]|nr:N-6 DNA methylase [Myxococcales bacterium]